MPWGLQDSEAPAVPVDPGGGGVGVGSIGGLVPSSSAMGARSRALPGHGGAPAGGRSRDTSDAWPVRVRAGGGDEAEARAPLLTADPLRVLRAAPPRGAARSFIHRSRRARSRLIHSRRREGGPLP